MLAHVSTIASVSLSSKLASSFHARAKRACVLLGPLLSFQPRSLCSGLGVSAATTFCKFSKSFWKRGSFRDRDFLSERFDSNGLRAIRSCQEARLLSHTPKLTAHNRPNRKLSCCSSSADEGGDKLIDKERTNPTEESESMVGREMEGRKRTFQIVVAATEDLGIGQGGSLPWKLPGDMQFFKQVTSTTSKADKHNAVVMGRKTWESILRKFQPLAGRLNVVLTRSASDANAQSSFPEGVLVSSSLDSALSLLASAEYQDNVESVFVIGGGQVYQEAMVSPLCDAVHLTEVDTRGTPLKCDTFIPPVDASQFRVWSASAPRVENGLRYSIVTHVRTQGGTEPPTREPNTPVDQAAVAPSCVVAEADGGVLPAGIDSGNPVEGGESGAAEKRNGVGETSGREENSMQGNGEMKTDRRTGAFERLPPTIRERHEEHQYLKLIDEIIREGAHKEDRTGTGTISKFGCSMRFNLRKSFPLLTTKRVFWRGVVEELLWFVAGSTNAKLLQDKGVHIWDGNGSREYLDSIGLKEREEQDLGPVYGFQWRHFGAKYTDMHADYTGKGVDQLADLIHRIKTKPEDRRLILSAWNPADLKLMALPPCHMFCQFYVADGELSCQMYQRSCDMGLGVPFNIASYSLLTLMIAQVCGLRPGEFVHVLGDAHVYSNHVEPLREQLRNSPRPFPVLKVNPAVKDIDSFTASDFELVGYEPHKKIAMKMAV